MLKARQNQTIPNKSVNTNGSTSAASAISAPSADVSLRATPLKFSKLQIPRLALDDKSQITNSPSLFPSHKTTPLTPWPRRTEFLSTADRRAITQTRASAD